MYPVKYSEDACYLHYAQITMSIFCLVVAVAVVVVVIVVYCNEYIILLCCLYYFIVLKVKIKPLIWSVLERFFVCFAIPD